MPEKIYSLTRADIKKLLEKIAYPLKDIRTFFLRLSLLIDQSVQLAFRTLGASNGEAWVGFSELTRHPHWKAKKSSFPEYRGYHYNPNKWNRRPGSNDSKRRKYSDSSKLLQASGIFRQSWRVMNITRNELKYGSVHKRAKQIMSDPDRPVLTINRARL